MEVIRKYNQVWVKIKIREIIAKLVVLDKVLIVTRKYSKTIK